MHGLATHQSSQSGFALTFFDWSGPINTPSKKGHYASPSPPATYKQNMERITTRNECKFGATYGNG